MSNIDPAGKSLTSKAMEDSSEAHDIKHADNKKKASSFNRKVTAQKNTQSIFSQVKSLFKTSSKYDSSLTRKTVSVVDETDLIKFFTGKVSSGDAVALEEALSTIDTELLQHYNNGMKAKKSEVLKDKMTNFIYYLKDNYLHNVNNTLTKDQKKILYDMFVDMSARVDILKDSQIAVAKTKKAKTQAYQTMLDECVKCKLNIGTKDAAGIGSTFFRVTNINSMTNSKNAEDIKDTCEECLGLYARNLNFQMHKDMSKNLQSYKKKLNTEATKDNPDQNKIEEFNRIINNITGAIDKYIDNTKRVNSGELSNHEGFMDDCYGKMMANLLTMAQKENITLNLEKIPLNRL
jgi:hypothetical protein